MQLGLYVAVADQKLRRENAMARRALMGNLQRAVAHVAEEHGAVPAPRRWLARYLSEGTPRPGQCAEVARDVARRRRTPRDAIYPSGRFCEQVAEQHESATASGKVGAMVESIGIALLLAAPWIVAAIWVWSRAPCSDAVPPSMGERARQRLWT
jgi:hypothetical protein